MATKLDLTSLKEAVSSLEEGLGTVGNTEWFAQQSIPVQNTLLAGVIQNFEFVYEISVKMLRRRIELDSASPSEVDFSDFRDLVRTAAEKGLIQDVEAWFEYRKMRNITSHTYDHKKAQKVYEGVRAFIGSALDSTAKVESTE